MTKGAGNGGARGIGDGGQPSSSGGGHKITVGDTGDSRMIAGSGSTCLSMADSDGWQRGKTDLQNTALSDMISFHAAGSQNHHPL